MRVRRPSDQFAPVIDISGQDAAFAVVVGAHDEQAIFDGNGDDQRPEDQRQTSERRFRGKMPAGRTDDRLQRIERAGSEIAIDDPKRRECGRRCGLASDARQRRIVFVNDVRGHRSWFPCWWYASVLRVRARRRSFGAIALTRNAASVPHLLVNRLKLA
jgi:hypothetical protein